MVTGFDKALHERRKAWESKDPTSDREALARKTAIEMLDRWLEHPGAGDAWSAIQNHSPPAASEFIEGILHMRIPMAVLDEHLKAAPHYEAKAEHMAKRLIKEKKHGLAAEILARLSKATEQADAILGRKKKAASKKRFMALCREMFIANCGQPLDATVATLTEIAFGSETTAEASRGTAKRAARPTGTFDPK